jgi:PAS domain S-box-containing protein
MSVGALHLANDAEFRRLRTLYRLLAALSQADELDSVYEAALSSLLEATSADRAAILLFDDDGVMRFKAARGLSDEYREAVTGHSPWEPGAMDARPLAISDAANDPAAAAFRGALAREGIRALAFVPLALKDGVFGKFMLYYSERHAFSEEELEIAQAVAAHVALATQHKRAEIARALSEERLQAGRRQSLTANQRLAAIVESSDDAIIAKDLNGIITSWNGAAERIFGYTAAEMVGKPIAILAAPGHLDEMPEILSRIRQGRSVQHYETRRRRKDGGILDVSLTISPVRDSAGEIIGASKIARDITEQKRADRERRLLLAREREARRTAELLNSVGPRLLAQLDPEKLAQEITDIASALVGAEFGAFLSTLTGEENRVHASSGHPPEAFAGVPMSPDADLLRLTLGGAAPVLCEDLTQDPRFADTQAAKAAGGKLQIRSYLAAPVLARSGEVLGGLFFGHSDPGKFGITHADIIAGIAAQSAIAMDNARLFEQAQWVQTELKRSNEELRRANRDLEVFAYSASHDLQEPLRTIGISAQLIERSCGPQMRPDAASFLDTILTSSRRMRALVDDLLAYTKAAKCEEGIPPSVDSERVLADVLETLRGPIDEVGATVTASKLPAVAIHGSRLAQLFQNLISNAIKYRSKEVPSIHVTAKEQDGWCVFSVADNGIGIDPQFAEQIFGLFKRLHGRDEYPGSGIGLAICQRVVEQYGGRIWLDQSTPGGGSTFSFALPRRT